MKKKWLSLLAVPAALCALVPFAACNDNGAQLEFDTKYFSEDHLDRDNECQRSYYLFRKDGTGEYHYYYTYLGQTSHYTITFDYSYIDKDKDTVICTYKSVSYEAEDNNKSASTYWSRMLLVSENLVMPTTSTTYYFSETYLKDHPEFAAKE